jgi:hypothetical protein
VGKIKDIVHPPGAILCLFDVAGLFPSIPKAVTIQRLGELLVNSNIPHEEIAEFFDLLKICWSPNYCKFRGDFYEFPEEVGIPIGSPLGSLISEVFMSKFEHDLFSSGHELLSHVFYWHRYVDDVLCTWTGNQDLLSEFLNYLNAQHPSIKFTLEVGGSTVNFLDLTISEKDGLIEFGIYRKNTATDVTVHGSSFCPMAHKVAAFNSLIHRLTHIPLCRSAFQKELMTVKHLAKVNDVQVDIDRMLRRKLIRKSLDLTTSLPRELNQDKRKRWIRLPFLGKLSSELRRTLQPFGFRPAFYNPITLRNLFVSLKDRIANNERSGVYRVECDGCQGVYIGETSRQLNIRVAEHKKAWEEGVVGKSALADHLINSGHSLREGSEKLLHKENSYFKRLALEHIEIVRHKNNDDVTLLNRYIPDAGLIELMYESQ